MTWEKLIRKETGLISGEIMATKGEIENALKTIAGKLDDPKLKERFMNFNKTMQFNFKDAGLNYNLAFEKGTVKGIKEGAVEKPDVSVEMDSDTFIAILKKEINPINAYSAGKIKVNGEMSDLLKLQKLLG
jgi:3-hydroxyacyl-CoA dehydrogenase/3a,7a,12a-trihydroxy-5b-cholest-24-enoyl-CoA hydratase